MRVGKLGSFLAAAALLAASSAFASGPVVGPKPLEEKVRHELNMLPYYGVFDDISFRVDGDKVTLTGQVWQPVLKLQTESAIKHIEGVKQVDDQIRMQTLRSIYGFPALNRYVLNPHPSIHIIVKNGNVTLTGVVANKMDSEMAYVRANGIHGVFSVKNELRVENQ